MTYQEHFSVNPSLIEEISKSGLEFMPELIRIIVNAAMLEERQKYLGVAPYERDEERQGHANGFKDKTVKTMLGDIFFCAASTGGRFYPEACH